MTPEEQARQHRIIFELDRVLAGSPPIYVRREAEKAKAEAIRKLEQRRAKKLFGNYKGGW